MGMLKTVGLSLLKSLLTEKFIKEIIVYLLKWLAQKSKNKVDDKIVVMIEKAMEDKEEA